MNTPFSFYLVFNPFFENENPELTQAHEFHAALKDTIQKDKNGHLYWGKIKSKSNKREIEFDKFESAIKHNIDNKKDTHLFISDYKYLWAAKITEVTQTPPDTEETLPFYAGKDVEIWFKVTDMTIVENTHNETSARISDLFIGSELAVNDFHNCESMNPYLSNIRYPLIVQDSREEYFFQGLGTDIEPTTHKVLKFNPMISNMGTKRISNCLTSFCFPRKVLEALPQAAKEAILSAEMDILDNRFNNVNEIAFSYLRSLEAILNHLFKKQIIKSGMGDEIYVDPKKGFIFSYKKSSDLIPIKDYTSSFSMPKIINFITHSISKNDLNFKKAFRDKPEFIEYITSSFSQSIKKYQLNEIRNMLAHPSGKNLTHEDALAIRANILGVGRKGIINGIYESYNPKLYSKLLDIQGNYKLEKAAA